MKYSAVLFLAAVWSVMFVLSAAGVWLLKITHSMNSIAFHGVIEGVGAFIALFFSFFLFHVDNNDQKLSRFHYVSLALIVFGIFELFHAMSSPGELFVWYHVLGMGLGSVLFLSVFLPERNVSRELYYGLPWIVTAASVALAVLIGYYSEILPHSLKGDRFADADVYVNVISAPLFLFSTVLFARRYRLEHANADFYFIALTLMLACTAFLFPFSVLWGDVWWYWHFIRFGGLLFVLLYFIHYISQKNKNFISREIESNIIRHSIDGIITRSLDGNILTWNHGAEKLFGYSADEIIGQPITRLCLHDNDMKDREARMAEQIIKGGL